MQNISKTLKKTFYQIHIYVYLIILLEFIHSDNLYYTLVFNFITII